MVSCIYPNIFAPQINKEGETINASFANTGTCNLSLLDAAMDGITNSLRLQSEWSKQGQGNPNTWNRSHYTREKHVRIEKSRKKCQMNLTIFLKYTI